MDKGKGKEKTHEEDQRVRGWEHSAGVPPAQLKVPKEKARQAFENDLGIKWLLEQCKTIRKAVKNI